ncbi:MAG: ABC transporter ATP-binding protein [bacterium]|nr:ABC transporter ATP-binding protein [bacterium]
MERTVLIRLCALARHYEVGGETVRALDGVDLELPQGDFAAIMGPSGSGKSTLMNLLGCLDRPTAGSYWLAGHPIHDERDDAVLSRLRGREIGFIFQTFNLLPRLDAVENVELPLVYQGVAAPERRRRAEEALRRVGLSERARHRPGQLSGGQRQRVAIARALVTGPSLLLADEPTGNLDSRTAGEILDLFDHLHGEGQTLVVVTHEAEVATRARRIIHLHDGRVERIVTPSLDTPACS